jgi:hypothetical protein
MNSNDFFKDKSFMNKWKRKSGIYIIEQKLFSKYLKYPVYKVGYANNLYSRVASYRTMYGLIPFTIHTLYAIPQGIYGAGARTNHANLMEKMIHKTAKKYDAWTGLGEWFKDLHLLMNIVNTIREKHLEKYRDAPKWEFYHKQYSLRSLKKIELVDEKEISGMFKDVIFGEKETRSGQYTDGNDKNEKIILDGGKRLNIPTTYIDENGNEVKFLKKKK